jgi:hypothetical protein
MAEVFPDLEDRAKMYANGPSYTGIIDGEVAICAGVVILWPGVGEAWIAAAPLVYQYPLFLHRNVTRMLDRIIAEYNLHRVQAIVTHDFVRGQRWIERIGFKREGMLTQYLPDKTDCIRYARYL